MALGVKEFQRQRSRAPANDFFDFNTGVLEVDPHGLEHTRNAGPFTNQAQKDLLSSDEVVAEASASSWANMITLMAFSVKRSNIVEADAISNQAIRVEGGVKVRLVRSHPRPQLR